MRVYAALILCTLSFRPPTYGGGISYLVTLNAAACHDVHLGRFSIPLESKGLMSGVDSAHCRYEVRSGREAELYVGVLCTGAGPVPGQGVIWPSAPEKFAIDLSRASKVRRIDEATWKSAPILERSDHGGPPSADERGYRYNNHLFEKSGPSWYGEGISDVVPANLSWTGIRVAVNSWDGIDETYGILDFTSWFQRNHVKGHFWVDMYDTAKDHRLVPQRRARAVPAPCHFLFRPLLHPASRSRERRLPIQPLSLADLRPRRNH